MWYWLTAIVIVGSVAFGYGIYTGRVAGDRECRTVLEKQHAADLQAQVDFSNAKFAELESRYAAARAAAVATAHNLSDAQGEISRLAMELNKVIADVPDNDACRVPAHVLRSLNKLRRPDPEGTGPRLPDTSAVHTPSPP